MAQNEILINLKKNINKRINKTKKIKLKSK